MDFKRTSREYFKELILIHYGMIMGQIILGIIAPYLVKHEIKLADDL